MLSILAKTRQLVHEVTDLIRMRSNLSENQSLTDWPLLLLIMLLPGLSFTLDFNLLSGLSFILIIILLPGPSSTFAHNPTLPSSTLAFYLSSFTVFYSCV